MLGAPRRIQQLCWHKTLTTRFLLDVTDNKLGPTRAGIRIGPRPGQFPLKATPGL